MLADGKIYITNEEGLTSVIKAGPKFEVLAENALNDYCLSSPAISDGQIFLRVTGYLYCIGRAGSARPLIVILVVSIRLSAVRRSFSIHV